MQSSTLYILVGLTGAVLMLLGFYRTSIGRWTGKSFWYELDNVFGAGLMIVYQVHYHAYVSVMVNLIWVVVAFRGVITFAQRYRFQKRAKRRSP